MKRRQVRIVFRGKDHTGVLVCRRSQMATAIVALRRRGLDLCPCEDDIDTPCPDFEEPRKRQPYQPATSSTEGVS